MIPLKLQGFSHTTMKSMHVNKSKKIKCLYKTYLFFLESLWLKLHILCPFKYEDDFG